VPCKLFASNHLSIYPGLVETKLIPTSHKLSLLLVRKQRHLYSAKTRYKLKNIVQCFGSWSVLITAALLRKRACYRVTSSRLRAGDVFQRCWVTSPSLRGTLFTGRCLETSCVIQQRVDMSQYQSTRTGCRLVEFYIKTWISSKNDVRLISTPSKIQSLSVCRPWPSSKYYKHYTNTSQLSVLYFLDYPHKENKRYTLATVPDLRPG
jgi:hypothetical protein